MIHQRHNIIGDDNANIELKCERFLAGCSFIITLQSKMATDSILFVSLSLTASLESVPHRGAHRQHWAFDDRSMQRIKEQVLHHLDVFQFDIGWSMYGERARAHCSRTRLPSHHLTANGSPYRVCCYTLATGFAAGASFVHLRSDCASHFFSSLFGSSSSSFVRFVPLFDLPLAFFHLLFSLLSFKTNAHIRPDHHQQP